MILSYFLLNNTKMTSIMKQVRNRVSSIESYFNCQLSFYIPHIHLEHSILES